MLDICRNDLCKSVRTQMKDVTCFFELMKRSSLLATLYECQQNHSIRRKVDDMLIGRHGCVVV
jgi:hypothetical protein